MTKPAQITTPELRRGDLLQATDLDAIVNPVNCVGAMGKGLAQQFKRRYPAILEPYRTACQNGELTVSQPLTVRVNAHDLPRYVVNLATKLHWRNPSKIEWIDQGLHDMYQQLEELDINSVGMPALGVGLGMLPWHEVKQIIDQHAAAHPEIRTVVFLPR